ncbi:hypothetical protein BU17DRAFT_70347 [Hysterangium stoloniferum]|nr:hypothetical protein BU17DRAFT_70347 [Hysterangium stoloniferum]
MYTVKRHTKGEMIEVHCIEAEEKTKKMEEAARQVMKQKELMKLVAEYEEELGSSNLYDTPIAHGWQLGGPLYSSTEATLILQGRGTPKPFMADVVQSEGEDNEEPSFVQESEVTNQNDEDYIEEVEEEEDQDSSTRLEIEVLDFESDEDARPVKKSKKKSKSGMAAKSLIPRNVVKEMALLDKMTVFRQDNGKGVGKKEKKEVQEQNQGPGIVKGGASIAHADVINKPQKSKCQPTLYYWNLSSDPTKKDGVISNWATTVSKLASSSQPGSASRSSTLSFSKRHTSTHHSTTSTLDAKKTTNVQLPASSDKSNNDTDSDSKDAAVNSPLKNGACATSSGIVKVDSMQLTKILKNQLHGKKGQNLAFSNKDLPDGVHNKDHWHKHFIPTFLWWVGKQPDPWNLADYDIVDTLQEIWDVIYKKIFYVVEQKDAVFAVVYAMQHPYCHLFQGPLILHTLAAHHCAIHGAIKILSLGDADLLTNQPYGALAMSATAVEHGLTLIAKGNITIEAIAQSKMTHKKLVFEQSSSDIKGKDQFQ